MNRILSLNERNLEFVFKHNPAKYQNLADDKLMCKELLISMNLPVPKLYRSYKYFQELNALKQDLWQRSDFVMKPARNSTGNGVLVFARFEQDYWVTTSGTPFSASDLHNHATEILNGYFALDGNADAVMIEKRVLLAECFSNLTASGIPDIRIIVFQERPIMAMLRLPTKRSSGKANLHAGGIGVGIDLKSGRTTGAQIKGKDIAIHPDTGVRLKGIAIPHWKEILALAVQVQKNTPLGYLGIDFVIDRKEGPQILELNIRPGLEIQNVKRNGFGQEPMGNGNGSKPSR